MNSRFRLLAKYLRYYFTAANGKGHGIHSPFVFDFVKNVLNDDKHYSGYELAGSLRKKLLDNDQLLEVEDLGAGSSVSSSVQRSISSIARTAAKPEKFARLLFRIVKYYQPDNLLELGTSLGITASYLSLAKPDAKLITLEGAPAVAAEAKKNFEMLGLKNIELIVGNFDTTLPALVSRAFKIDFAFIDGNHRREPTERYFQQVLSRIENDAVLVVDDIHWSREMETAWENMKKHPEARCSIDLFFTGIIFFRKEFREKQHFVIRF